MAFDVAWLVSYIKSEPSLSLSPVLRQVLVERVQHEPTEGEIARARDVVMGRVSVGNPN